MTVLCEALNLPHDQAGLQLWQPYVSPPFPVTLT